MMMGQPAMMMGQPPMMMGAQPSHFLADGTPVFMNNTYSEPNSELTSELSSELNAEQHADYLRLKSEEEAREAAKREEKERAERAERVRVCRQRGWDADYSADSGALCVAQQRDDLC